MSKQGENVASIIEGLQAIKEGVLIYLLWSTGWYNNQETCPHENGDR